MWIIYVYWCQTRSLYEMIFVYIKSKTTGATYQCSYVLLNLCFLSIFINIPQMLMLILPISNLIRKWKTKKLPHCRNNSKIKYKNRRKSQNLTHIFYNNIYTIVYIYFYYRLEILNTQQFYITHLTLSCMTYIKIYVNKICADQNEVADGKLNVQIMDVLEIFINHEIYEIASPWCL